MAILDFERPLQELEERIEGLKKLPSAHQLKIQDEIERLEEKSLRLLKELYKDLTPWEKVLLARHPERPKATEYIQRLMENFVPLAGDRLFGEDPAVISGLATFRGHSVVVLGHEKGHDVDTRVRHNFGMAHPEGYRKAIRLMSLADQFMLPILFFVDTMGAYAGIGAEERGQSEAIASCLEKSFTVRSPLLSVIIGEGGSGGAVAFSTSNYIAMLEHSVYSVISPEGCASILWRSAEKKELAAAAQKLTAKDLLQLKVIDDIITEPLGGAHRNKTATIDSVGAALEKALLSLSKLKDCREKRREKFIKMTRLLIDGDCHV